MRDEIRDLIRRIADLERRLDNVIVTGQVTDVDYDKGLYRMQDEPGSDFKSPWMPISAQAGDAKDWHPLVKGQQVRAINPGGEFSQQSWIAPAGYRDKFQSPSNSPDERVLTMGGASKITLHKDFIELSVGGNRIKISGDEIVTYGKTRLNDGQKKVHRVEDRDSANDKAVTGADDVFA